MKNLNSQGAGLGLTISNLIVKGLSGNGRGLNLVSNTDSAFKFHNNPVRQNFSKTLYALYSSFHAAFCVVQMLLLYIILLLIILLLDVLFHSTRNLKIQLINRKFVILRKAFQIQIKSEIQKNSLKIKLVIYHFSIIFFNQGMILLFLFKSLRFLIPSNNLVFR